MPLSPFAKAVLDLIDSDWDLFQLSMGQIPDPHAPRQPVLMFKAAVSILCTTCGYEDRPVRRTHYKACLNCVAFLGWIESGRN